MGDSSANSSTSGQQNGPNTVQLQQQQKTEPFAGTNGFGAFSGSGEGKGDMASVASSFSFKPNKADDNKAGIPSLPNSFRTFPFLNAQNTVTTGSGFSDSILNSQPTGATATSNPPPLSLSPALRPQTTGFSGLKAFKPSSSFGTSLLESLPPIPSLNSPSGDSPVASASTPTSAPGGMSSFGITASTFTSQPAGTNSQPTGALSFGGLGARSNLGTGLRPQMTGGAANPFRASTFSPSGGLMNGSTGSFTSSTSSPSAFGASAGSFSTSEPSSNGAPFGAFGTGAWGSGFNPSGVTQDPSKQQQPQQVGSASLI